VCAQASSRKKEEIKGGMEIRGWGRYHPATHRFWTKFNALSNTRNSVNKSEEEKEEMMVLAIRHSSVA